MATGRPDWTTRAQVDLVQVDVDVISRPAYYDRAPATVTLAYDAEQVAPHAATVRATYTVPAGGRLFVEIMRASMLRFTVYSGGGRQYAVITHNSSSVANVLCGARIRAEVIIVDTDTIGTVGLFVAGDVLRIVTRDTGVGGDIDYQCFFKGTSFDA